MDRTALLACAIAESELLPLWVDIAKPIDAHARPQHNFLEIVGRENDIESVYIPVSIPGYNVWVQMKMKIIDMKIKVITKQDGHAHR